MIALVDAAGALVTKEQLLQQAWPGLMVEEANVHVQVSHLRKLLGARAIATVAPLGYRFAMPCDGQAGRAAPEVEIVGAGERPGPGDRRRRRCRSRGG